MPLTELDQLERIATALETIANSLPTSAVEAAPKPAPKARAKKKPAAKKAAKTDTPAKAPSLDEVRAALVGLADSKGKAAAIGVLSDLGVDRVSDLKADQYTDAVALAAGAQG